MVQFSNHVRPKFALPPTHWYSHQGNGTVVTLYEAAWLATGNRLGLYINNIFFLEEKINTPLSTYLHFALKPWLRNPAKSKTNPPSWLN